MLALDNSGQIYCQMDLQKSIIIFSMYLFSTFPKIWPCSCFSSNTNMFLRKNNALDENRLAKAYAFLQLHVTFPVQSLPQWRTARRRMIDFGCSSGFKTD
jgi:hypothetical protein